MVVFTKPGSSGCTHSVSSAFPCKGVDCEEFIISVIKLHCSVLVRIGRCIGIMLFHQHITTCNCVPFHLQQLLPGWPFCLDLHKGISMVRRRERDVVGHRVIKYFVALAGSHRSSSPRECVCKRFSSGVSCLCDAFRC